jgi:hypothetical protein
VGKYSNIDDYEEAEESGFSNIKGYFLLVTKTLHTRIEAFLANDLKKEWDSLYTLRWLLIGYFKPEELQQIEKEFMEIRYHMIEYAKSEQEGLQKKSSDHYNILRIKMNKIADQLSLKMHQSNLYTILREKGSFLYN